MEYKRPRLVAETADDLQNILFGEMVQSETANAVDAVTEMQVPVPLPEPEPEVFSDSDRGMPHLHLS